MQFLIWAIGGFLLVFPISLLARRRSLALQREFPRARAQDLWAWIYLLFFWYLGQSCLYYLLLLAGIEGSTAAIFASFLANILALAYILGCIYKRAGSYGREIGFTSHQWLRNLLIGVQMGLVISVMNLLALKLASELKIHYIKPDSLEAWLYSCKTLDELLLGIVVVVIAAPLVEELIFRGIAYTGMRAFLGAWPSALLTSFVFAALHNHGVFNGKTLLLFFFALLWVRCRESSASLVGPIVAHSLLNLSLALGSWAEGRLLENLSWRGFACLYLFFALLYLSISIAKRLKSSLRCELPLASNVVVDGDASCARLFRRESCISALAELLGALLLFFVCAASFVFGSPEMQKSTVFLSLKAQGLAAKGRGSEAIRLLQEGLAKNPRAYDLYSTLSLLHYHAGNFEKALEAAEKLKEKSPGRRSSLHYHNLKTLCLADGNGDLDRALESAQEAFSLASKGSRERANIEDTLGWVHYHRGEYQKAAEYMESAMSKIHYADRLSAYELKYHLGLLRLKQGKRKEAKKLLTWLARSRQDNRFVKAANRALKDNFEDVQPRRLSK